MPRGPSADLTAPTTRLATPAVTPPAVRAPRSRWRDPRLVVGIAVVALCTVGGARLLVGADDTVDVWAARTSLVDGQQLTSSDLVSRSVRFADQSDSDHYLSADQSPPLPAIVSRAVGAGELVPRAVLGTSAEGSLTEVPISVAADGVPGTIRTGSTVDVWVTPDRGTRSTLVFEDVSVVSAPPTDSSFGSSSTRQVIVGVPKAQSARLPASIAALTAGTVVLTVQR